MNTSRRSQIAFTIALAMVFLGFSIQYSLKVLKPRKDGYTQGAINRWALQLQGLEDGENIHEKYNFPNPPIMSQMLWPISELITFDPLVGALTWYYLKVALAVLCMIWAFRLVESPDRPFPAWAKAITVLVALKPIVGDLSHGNVNIFILFLVMACLYSFARGKDLLSGVLLALAIACKVTPALFIVYFAWKREWRVLIGAAIGLALFFLVLPSTIFAVQDGSLSTGWERNWHALTSWKKGMIDPYLIHGIVTPEKENQSLPGLLTRLLTHSPSFSAWIDDRYVPLAFHNVAELDRDTIKRLVQAAQVAFLALMVLACRTRFRFPLSASERRPSEVSGPRVKTSPPNPLSEAERGNPTRTGWRPAAEFSIILVGMLLFSERTWKHHCVTLLLPFAVLSYALAASSPKAARWTAGVALFVATLLILSTSSGVFGNEVPKSQPIFDALKLQIGGTVYVATFDAAVQSEATAELGLVPNSPGKFAQVYGAYTWAFLSLIGGLVVLLIGGRKPYTRST